MATGSNQKNFNGSLTALGEAPPYSSQMLEKLEIIGLHYGSGVNLHPRWLNSDMLELVGSQGGTSVEGRIVHSLDAFYLQHRANRSLPLADACVPRVFAEHFLEHVPPHEGIAWLREMHRLLKPGGLARISTPDLEKYIRGYLDPELTFYRQHLQRLQAMGVNRMPPGRAGMINQIFYFWGHRWLYDAEELVRTAVAAGFQTHQIQFAQFRQSQDPEMQALDLPIRNDESLYVELRKE